MSKRPGWPGDRSASGGGSGRWLSGSPRRRTAQFLVDEGGCHDRIHVPALAVGGTGGRARSHRRACRSAHRYRIGRAGACPAHARPAPGRCQRRRPPLTPQQAAQEAIAAAGLSTAVSTDPNVSVAGQSAYELVLAPKDHRSLIGQVRIAVDAANGVPLRVEVFARGAQSPAIRVGYAQIQFTAPAPSELTFTPPPGATVRQGGSARAPNMPVIDQGPRRTGPAARGSRGERPLAAVAFDQVVRAVEPEVRAGSLVVVVGEVDGLGGGPEQVLGVQRLAGLGPAPGVP